MRMQLWHQGRWASAAAGSGIRKPSSYANLDANLDGSSNPQLPEHDSEDVGDSRQQAICSSLRFRCICLGLQAVASLLLGTLIYTLIRRSLAPSMPQGLTPSVPQGLAPSVPLSSGPTLQHWPPGSSYDSYDYKPRPPPSPPTSPWPPPPPSPLPPPHVPPKPLAPWQVAVPQPRQSHGEWCEQYTPQAGSADTLQASRPTGASEGHAAHVPFEVMHVCDQNGI